MSTSGFQSFLNSPLGQRYLSGDEGETSRFHPCEVYESWDSSVEDEEFHFTFGKRVRCAWSPPGRGSVLGAIANLTNVAVGAGLLTFPYVFYQTGIGLGLILLILIAIILYILGEMMSNVCKQLHSHAPNVYLTYEIVSDLILGRKITIFVVLCVVVTIFSAQVASLVIIGDMIDPIVEEYGKNATEWWTGRPMITAILCIFIFPLCCMKKIDNLRWTSALAVISLCLVAVIVTLFTVDYFISGDSYGIVNESQRGEIEWFVFSTNIFVAVPIIAYSMAFHIQIPPVYQELHKKTRE